MAPGPEALPIAAFREELVRRLRTERVLIVVGETGSGKTTQLCQYALDDGLVAPGKLVAVSQPRRVAAIAAARRVAEERCCTVGSEVAYTVRFDDTVSDRTRIRYMTDGSLLREAIDSPRLERYSLIIMDEAHERSLNTDVLFGLLRRLLNSGARPDLRLVVASATLDMPKFSAFFGNCGDLRVPGRTFPVDIFHASPAAGGRSQASLLDGSGGQYVEDAVELCMRLHRTRPVGPSEDILVFLTGAKEIALACAALEQLAALDAAHGAHKPLLVLPLHAGLPSDMQARVFAPPSASVRKIVVATNIAETSLTIDGIRAVIDCGLAKLHSYDSARGMELLLTKPISKAAARQRAGRAGRTQRGECYRLYTESDFAGFPDETEPEIQRASLASTALALKSMGLPDLLNFPLLDPPPRAALLRALLQLHAIGALDEVGQLTALGRRIARLPVEPRLGAALATAAQLGCLDELATIAAMLSGEDPFVRTGVDADNGGRPLGGSARAANGEADERGAGGGAEGGPWARARARLTATPQRRGGGGGGGGGAAAIAGVAIDVREADHLLLLALFLKYAEVSARTPSGGSGQAAAIAWAKEWSVHLRVLQAARDVRTQLVALISSSGVASSGVACAQPGGPQPRGARPPGAGSAAGAAGEPGADAGAVLPSEARSGTAEPLGRRIRRAICAGYFGNAVRRIGAGGDACVPLAAPVGSAGGSGAQRTLPSGLLHPLSQSADVLCGAQAFVYHELVWTPSGASMRHLCRVESEWLDAPLHRLRSAVDPLILAGARPAAPAIDRGAPGEAESAARMAARCQAAPRSKEDDERVQAARERYLKRRRCGSL